MQTFGKSLFIKGSRPSGVTLLEVIMAIIIFGIGILVIMSMISTNIGRLYDIQRKDTALMIAKEGIDVVYHLRDSNIERGMYWNCVDIDFTAPDNCADYFFSTGSVDTFIIDWDGDTWYSMEPFTATGDSEVYYHTGVLYSNTGGVLNGFLYNHQATNGGTPGLLTDYRRRIEFRPLSGYATWTGNVLEVTSIVEWDRGETIREVILQSIIGDIRI